MAASLRVFEIRFAALPYATIEIFFFFRIFLKALKSAPLSKPPRISVIGDSKLLIAAITESMLVALESL